MLNGLLNRMHRYTRPSDYMDNSRQARNMRMQRPGSNSFSFTGDFPEALDMQPVQAGKSRRSYTNGRPVTGEYHAVSHMDTHRIKSVSRYGVQLVPAVLAVFALVVVLGSVYLSALADQAEVAKQISAQQGRLLELEEDRAEAESQISAQYDDVAIRRDAVRLGLISSKGATVIYLTAPNDAQITPAMAPSTQNMASILGQ